MDMTPAPAAERAPSPAVDRALTVLEILISSETPLTLSALAREANIPLATCAAIAQTLELRGYASRHVVGRSHFWRPTLRINGLAAQLVRKVDLATVTQPYLRRIVEVTGFPAHAGVLEANLVIYVGKVAAPGMVQFDTYPGKTAPFYLTALGRAIAAHLPSATLEPLIEHLVPGSGPKAPKASKATLARQLAEVRERGFAVEDEEEDPGIGCIAAPFFDSSGNVLGSLGVTGFADQLLRQQRDAAVSVVCEQAAALTEAMSAGTVAV